ncbi:hypothetical protein [Klebsiella pasteurii]|uniref:hypothetical protein n=1 Tax=Klebsiella pasteurii TaxID=2587529 RepID=UPI00287FB6C1|nr:hypothetical protein [Klebsiella pasteurii]MDV0995194.1 hypothetical protein [Klebsiella pasteurii]
MLLENEVDNAKRLAVNQRFWVPVLMCVDYISALKEATSYKFLFKGFWSIKYSASGCFLFVTLLLFLVFIFLIFFKEIVYYCAVGIGGRQGGRGRLRDRIASRWAVHHFWHFLLFKKQIVSMIC